MKYATLGRIRKNTGYNKGKKNEKLSNISIVEGNMFVYLEEHDQNIFIGFSFIFLLGILFSKQVFMIIVF